MSGARGVAETVGARNVSWLYAVYCVNYLSTILILACLAHRLGPQKLGTFAFADAVARYALLVVEYGFALSATRTVAQHRTDEKARGRIVAEVVAAQGALSLLVAAAYVLIEAIRSPASGELAVSAAAITWALVQAFYPSWYFLGCEQVRIVAMIDLAAKLGSLALIAALISANSPLWHVFALQALTAAAAAAIAFKRIASHSPIGGLTWRGLTDTLRNGFLIFLFKGTANIYTTASVLVLGLNAPPSAVGVFAGAERIARSAANSMHPLNQLFYPKISHQLAAGAPATLRTVRVAGATTVAFGLSMAVGIFLAAPLLVRLVLGAQFADAVPLLRTLLLIIPAIAVTNATGMQWLLPLNLDRFFTSATFCGGLLNILLLVVLTRLSGASGAAVAVAATEIAIAIGLYSVIRIRGIDPYLGRGCVSLAVPLGEHARQR